MKLIYDTPGKPAMYLGTDDELSGDSDALNALLPNAAPGTIVTSAGYATMKQVDAEGEWHLVSLGGGGGSGSGAISGSTECSLTGVLQGSGGAVAVKIVDASPTESSTNLIESGGTYSAIKTVADAVALKAPLASPALTGTPTAPTAAAGTNTTQVATTAFVQGELAAKAPLASPALTGTPTAPTAAAGTSTTQIATTAFASALATNLLYFQNITTGSAYGGTICAASNDKITADHVVVFCAFERPDYIRSDVAWATESGKVTLTGYAAAGTKATLILAKKAN